METRRERALSVTRFAFFPFVEELSRDGSVGDEPRDGPLVTEETARLPFQRLFQSNRRDE